MPEFTQSWAFWFLAGIIVGFIAGFVLAIIIAGSGRASRAEELVVWGPAMREEARKGELKIEIATKGKPEDD